MTAIWLKLKLLSLDSSNCGHFYRYLSGFCILVPNKGICYRYLLTLLDHFQQNDSHRVYLLKSLQILLMVMTLYIVIL